MIYRADKEFAQKLDSEDRLREYRKKFHVPDENTIYLDGNSLGRLPAGTIEHLAFCIEQEWGGRLIRSWNEGWYHKSREMGDKIAQIVGAKPGEVIVADSTSMNLYKLAYAALKIRENRVKIISDEINFPTDLYIIQGLVEQFGNKHQLMLAESKDGISVNYDDLFSMIDEQTALITLSHVIFKSGFLYDMAAVNSIARDKGALVIWDLSHSAGSVPVKLNDSGADMAVGCTYKYLNGGPGSPAYLYVRKELQEKLSSPVWGWFGAKNPFAFDLEFSPAEGMGKFLVGSPPILSMTALQPALDMIIDAGMETIREKSILQTEYLLFLIKEKLSQFGFVPGSPEDAMKRGSHISIKHPEGYRICQALINPKDSEITIIPDFREPDNIRLGIAPLYNSFEDIFICIDRMREVMVNKTYEQYSTEKPEVT
jgi:kynureninase